MASAPQRRRLPDRRPGVRREIAVGGQTIAVMIGLDPATGAPAEVFLSGAKEGSTLGAILDDASVVISVALQHGVPAQALRKSVGRVPDAFQPNPGVTSMTTPASVIGAVLDELAALAEAPEAAAP